MSLRVCWKIKRQGEDRRIPDQGAFRDRQRGADLQAIYGTFPDYGRVIPHNNDKELKVANAAFMSAVDRVSTIASERGRAVKLNLDKNKLVLSVNNPEGGSATEEIAVSYGASPLEIGFNARYLLDIAGQLEGEEARSSCWLIPARPPW